MDFMVFTNWFVSSTIDFVPNQSTEQEMRSVLRRQIWLLVTIFEAMLPTDSEIFNPETDLFCVQKMKINVKTMLKRRIEQ